MGRKVANNMSSSICAILGALVGDAAGVTLEFRGGVIDEREALNAMRMPGGGRLSVAPGQISDDGELTLALYGALTSWMTKKNDSNILEFPMEDVAAAYSEWHTSNPFDCGMTCGRAFGFFKSAANMQEKAVRYSIASEANGALMRCTPIPALLHRIRPYQTIAEFAALDASLSHPSDVCKDCNALYCVAIAYLLNNNNLPISERSSGALRLVESYQSHPKVLGWLEDSKNDISSFNCRINIGHVKHAFTLAMHFLRKCTSYDDAIKQTLMMGGDTDTNACIVGGMMGALHLHVHESGGIPDYMLEPVLKFDPVTWTTSPKMLIGHNRPAKYRAAIVMSHISLVNESTVKIR